MNIVNMFLIIMIVFTDIAICGIEALQNELENYDINHDRLESSSDHDQIHGVESFSFLSSQRKKTRRVTCNKFPRICRAKGSPGPSCCKKKCVDVTRDRHNCGKCGKKCKYNKICCNGKCVNPSFNKRHCGGCNNRCNNGGLCAFGLCSYS
ncbi:hypothetical protein TIFTF001_042459 [Ficus carica]|uniref:Stigma-specific STIG1-like protein 1 n=1 Tax=Ficus carica TaxID=3494 RepID=A0AA88A3D7_FICCA|nr:hypothetical protein TIFTF001_042451 [Ficus carica]GMN36521.1 hypothetical protein TIFTF001_042453 [Ficus carica]GMN36542.1 hypothetical protein TIFTF001_042457 [Ficus carica]GMN36550.1 hypothetical protein TIFTF001_042459 [Ficus carica]